MRLLPILTLFALFLISSSSRADEADAARAWHLGQKAMENDRFDEAIGQFQLSLRLCPTFAQGHLGLAACYLALGEDGKAMIYLKRYLRARPSHFLVRRNLAELLHRLNQPQEAREQYQRFLVQAQLHPGLGPEHLIDCHTHLMEIAEQLGDRYEAHLNRGIGLLLLARRRIELGGPAARRGSEELLCKAAAELTLARLERPEEARPSWYLHEVWTSLAQAQPARRWLRTAREQATPGTLTPGEMRDLCLAWSEVNAAPRRK